MPLPGLVPFLNVLIMALTSRCRDQPALPFSLGHYKRVHHLTMTTQDMEFPLPAGSAVQTLDSGGAVKGFLDLDYT